MATLVSTAELARREQQEPPLFPPGMKPGQRPTTSLSSYLDTCWEAAVDAKRPIEERLFDCLRRRKGEYDADKLAKIKKYGSVESYLKYTGMKVRAAKSWILDVIIPAGEKPWGLDPTPIPDLPEDVNEDILDEITDKIMRMAEVFGEMPSAEDVALRVRERREEIMADRLEEAKSRAKAMEMLIYDQFTEGGHEDALSTFIDDLTTFPSAILKGPVWKKKPVLQWDGSEARIVEQIIPCDDRISPFDFYPSPECGGVNDGYMFERRRVTKRELESFIGRPGYNEEEIRAALKEADGMGSALDIDVNDTERAYLEEKDPQKTAAGTAEDRVPILEFWGTVSGEMLKDWGLAVEDETRQYDITAIKVGRHVIKAMKNPDPLGHWPYYVTSYEIVPDSIWGNAIPELIAPIQDGMNMTVRALFDNIALAAGPQVAVDMERVDPRQKATAAKIWPKKVWLVNGSQLGATSMPIEFEQPKIIAPHLLRVLETLERLGDDQSGIPAYAYGSDRGGGATDTASGLSMLMDAASKGIRLVIANVGKSIVRPRIAKQFIYNMLYYPDDRVKGDVVPNVRGTLAEIMKARQNQERLQFMQSFVPPEVVTQLLKREGIINLIRKTTDNLDVPGLIPTNEELAEEQQTVINPPMPPASAVPGQSDVGGLAQ